MVQRFVILALTLLLTGPTHGEVGFSDSDDPKPAPAPRSTPAQPPPAPQPTPAPPSDEIYLKCEGQQDCRFYFPNQAEGVPCPEGFRPQSHTTWNIVLNPKTNTAVPGDLWEL